jgi:predicted nuclease with TOPRIM domain
MISLEQVKLLEAKVARAVEYVERMSSENAALVSERAGLETKLEANQKRIDELEVVVMRFKEDQSRIEDGILSALERLNQFEEAIEKSLKEKPIGKKNTVKTQPQEPQASGEPASKEIFFEIPEKEVEDDADLLNEDSSTEGELDIF